MSLPRSNHFNGKTFFQGHDERSGRLRDFLRWRLSKKSTPWPSRIVIPAQPPPPRPRADEVVVTWIGHASFLLQSTRLNLLIDPVFSERVSPVSCAGPRRAHPPGTSLASLPKIDAVLLSHDHYDHLDLPTLRTLIAQHDPVFVTPLRHSDLVSAAGTRRVIELDWWKTHRFTATSARGAASGCTGERFNSRTKAETSRARPRHCARRRRPASRRVPRPPTR